MVPSDEDGRAQRAETGAPAQLGLGEVPVRATRATTSLGPSPAVTRGTGHWNDGAGLVDAVGTHFPAAPTRLIPAERYCEWVSGLPSKGAFPCWGLMGSGTVVGAGLGGGGFF